MFGNKYRDIGLMLICLIANLTAFANEPGELSNKGSATLNFVTFVPPTSGGIRDLLAEEDFFCKEKYL